MYRGSWHAATVVGPAGSASKVQITWDYDGSTAELHHDELRMRGGAASTAGRTTSALKHRRQLWLKNTRVLVAIGPERARVGCILRVMAASETLCPGLWTGSSQANAEAEVELRDGDDVVPYCLEEVTAVGQDLQWLKTAEGLRAMQSTELAAPCAVQISGSSLLLAGLDLDRERAQEYLRWAQMSRKDAGRFGWRSGGSLSLMEADMREDMLVVLLPEEQAVWMRPDRIYKIEAESKTLLLFDTGGGTVTSGCRRLIICGGSDEQRNRAAALTRRPPEVAPVTSSSPAEVSAPAGASDPWAILQTMAWPENIAQWGKLQKTIWSGHPRLKTGWIRIMSKSRRSEYYLRLADKHTTTTIDEVLA